jgi:hypothetical protein
MINNRLIAALFIGACVAGANAQVNHFFWSNGTIPGTSGKNTDPYVESSWFGQESGKVNFVSAQDNDTTNTFSFYANFAKNGTEVPNAFWLAVSNGPNPKGTPGELALIYFDGTQAGTPKVTAYGYNGKDGFDSYFDGSGAAGIQNPDRIVSSVTNNSFLTRWDNSTDASGNRTLGFDINKSIINSYVPKNTGAAPWQGINFTDKVGIWFHAVSDASASYDPQGFLKTFTFDKGGYVDLENAKTKTGNSPVPEPASMLALGLGAVGLIRRKRKQS